MSDEQIRIGLDVGGTFTDIIVCRASDGGLALYKVPTTPHDIAVGLLSGLRQSGVPAQDITEIAHGTTVATNALLERSGAPTGLLTTAGFRDVLELREGSRRSLLGRQAAFEPLVPRQRRLEVVERVDASGSVQVPLREDAVRAGAEALRREGVEALAIAFLHADKNGVHERRAREILNGRWSHGPLVLGSEVCPFPDERLRAATAALAAYLTPLMIRYVESLRRVQEEAGSAARFRFIESAGASCAPEEIRGQPLRTILSGPAGGAVAAGYLAGLLGCPSVASADMGGTSFDVAVIQDGQPDLRGERTLEFGLRVAIPSVDIHTAGIGGGSLVWMDESLPGGLQVGPESAGVHPGPACFSRGGRKPTLTDANLLLGRLIGDRTDLGLPPLDVEAARQAMLAEVCPGLGLEPVAAAQVVLELAESRMAGFLRTRLAMRGVLPADATLVAFGGAGPVQAAAVARKLGVRQVVIPYLASGFSALGCLLTPPARAAMLAADDTLQSLTRERLQALLARAFPGAARGRLRLELVLRRGENPHEDLLSVPDVEESPAARLRRYQAFTEQAYGIRPAAESVRVTRVLAVLEEAPSPLALGEILETTFARARARWAEARGTRSEAGPGTPEVPLESLDIGEEQRGPALVVLPGASAFVPGGMAYCVDRWGNLLLEVER